jgi:hypothetical protein
VTHTPIATAQALYKTLEMLVYVCISRDHLAEHQIVIATRITVTNTTTNSDRENVLDIL